MPVRESSDSLRSAPSPRRGTPIPSGARGGGGGVARQWTRVVVALSVLALVSSTFLVALVSAPGTGGLSGTPSLTAIHSAPATAPATASSAAHGAAASGKPTLTLVPSQAPVGAAVTAEGQGFLFNPLGDFVTIVFDSSAVNCRQGPVFVQPDGSFACTFTIPPVSSAGNPYPVIAYTGSNLGVAAIPGFSVTPSIALSPARGTVGLVVNATGNGFHTDDPVSFLFGTAAIRCAGGDPTVALNGSFTCQFVVPSVPASGNPYFLVAVTLSDGSVPSAPFDVLPSVTPTPSEGAVGTTVKVSGTAFSAYSPITFTFDGQPLPSTCASNASGTFPGTTGSPCTLVVPPSPAGAEDIFVWDGAHSGNASFIVEPSFSLNAASGEVGDVVTAVGSGFASSSPIDFSFNGTPVASSCSANVWGSFPASASTPCTFVVPSTSLGSHLAAAQDLFSHQAVTTFAVLSSLPSLFTVEFTERGLPNGTVWSVAIGGLTATSNSGTVTFQLGNGSYLYSIEAISGYIASSVDGRFTVQGAATLLPIVFVAIPPGAQIVTFLESGLEVGATWGVTIGALTETSTLPKVVFELTDGSYRYSVLAPAGYSISPATGSFRVHGAPVSETISLVAPAPPTFAVTFYETGLDPRMQWNLTLNGVHQTTVQNAYVVNLLNGSYTVSVEEIHGFTLNRTYASFVVDGAPVNESFDFQRNVTVYAVTFEESGLAPGTPWAITVGNVSQTTTASSVVFPLTNGSYSFTTAAVAGYVESPAAGVFVVAGEAFAVVVTYVATGPGSFGVTFSETGLPAGTGWSVTIGSSTKISITPSIVFALPNGAHGYSVAGVPGYDPTVDSGTVVVNGAASTVSVLFAPAYSVTFVQTSLPGGSSWTVTLESETASTTESTITFSVFNGSYAWDAAATGAYLPSPSNGEVPVQGAGAVVSLVYEQTFPVFFAESGLPSGTAWSVNVTLTSPAPPAPSGSPAATAGSGFPVSLEANSTASTITVFVVNGTYLYTANPVSSSSGSYAALLGGGSIAVNGTLLPVVTPVYAPAATVTFREAGLPSGSPWSVTSNFQTTSGSVAALSMLLPNGTYLFRLSGPEGFIPLSSIGEVLVGETATTVTVPWTPSASALALTFAEMGLPGGTNWSVTLNGAAVPGGFTLPSNTSSATFFLASGAYSYGVGAVPGYTSSPAQGNVTVAHSSTFETVTFSPIPPANSGIPLWAVLLVLGLVLAFAAGLTIDYLVRRHGRRSRAAERPPEPAEASIPTNSR